ncbi:sulfide/dihydroorotate dehydrogenase-like FAD/NAD-binding protein [Marinisporobacter balticus]|uniref:sulfide/dihydroorotate dehydrogenase-like FAD/NAD-binding protein n=1 Tax=Marinisporobacter balticus TaxID=2018667 RepID=UPI00104DAC6A|nr:sulfide/dihydroorotate dehydrogenase-like FAD/NAD-binding protein [Marinisporobacter balticus]
MSTERLECIDAGSEYCPCYLAQTNECITCSHLQGEDFCDCNWRGVCIYQEFYWCSNKKKDQREVIKGKIIEKKMVHEEIMILKIAVTKTLARQLKHPGAYVFLRDWQSPHFFDVPMSIMDADEQKGEIYIAVQIIGAKTKALLACEDKILVKGPYWNGVLGLKNLKSTKKEKVLLVSRGIALAPSVLALKHLLKNKNKITFVIDPGKLHAVFIKNYIKDLNIETVELNLKEEKGLKHLEKIIKTGNYDLVYSAGSDRFHKRVENQINQLDEKVKFVITNNSKMCCGEGVCGACSCKTKNGTIVKMCKTQLEVREALEGGKVNG